MTLVVSQTEVSVFRAIDGRGERSGVISGPHWLMLARQQGSGHYRRSPVALAGWCLIAVSALAVSAFGQPTTTDSGATASESTATGSDEAEELPGNVAVEDVVSDEAIRERLQAILSATDRYQNLDVTVQDSVVFLRGTATKDSHRDWAGQLARNTESVAAVVNDLKVERKLEWNGTTEIVADSLRNLGQDALERSPLILAGLFMLLVTWGASQIASAIVRRVLGHSRLRVGLRDLIQQLTTIGVWLTGIMVAAVIVFPGMTPAKVLTVLGLSSVAVGFAFKDIFENFFAGILILWRYPFDKGDYIECGDVQGQIEEVTIRMTMIRQVDGQLVVVPNSYLFKNPVDVLTNRRSRRMSVICGVAYDADLNEAREVMRQAVERCQTVKADPPIDVFAQELGASSVNFEVTWWTDPSPRDVRRSRDEVITAVKIALNKAGIEIPFPQRTLWVKDPLPMRSLDSASEPA